MSSKLENTVTYSDKNWVDIESKYGLLTPLELVITESDATPNQHSQTKTSSNKRVMAWGARLAIFAGLLVALGNLPVQSQLMMSNANVALAPSATVATTAISEADNADATEVSPVENKESTFTLASFAPNHTEDYVDLNDYINEQETTTLLSNSAEPVELEIPETALESYVGKEIKQNKGKWVTYHVKSYDNPTNIFYKIGHQDLLKPFKKDEEIKKQIAALKKGSIVRANTQDGQLKDLIFSDRSSKSYVITLKNDEYVGAFKSNVFETRQARTSFIIKNGLFFDGKRAGVDQSVLKQIVKVFDWDIDFSHDIRVGDKVTAIFEELYHDGDKVGYQHLLAAEFINKGREFRTIRYTYKDGKSDYFTPQGREMKKAFIRTPIEHARVSSHFNPGRFHPKLHRIRAHKGTDFSARRGTPIMATGNGVITSIGWRGGYGKTVVIKHREGYKTIYAHMSKFKSGLKVGSKVYQRDIIGYVGSTGLATGPHLHYELHQDKKAVDPMRVKLPNSMSLSKTELKDFRKKAVNFVVQLNVLHRFVEADIEIDSAIGG